MSGPEPGLDQRPFVPVEDHRVDDHHHERGRSVPPGSVSDPGLACRARMSLYSWSAQMRNIAVPLVRLGRDRFALRATLSGVKNVPALVVLLAGVLTLALIMDVELRTAEGPPTGDLTRRQDEAYTDLYFENPKALSRTYLTMRPQSLSFAIHNVEQRDIGYRYALLVDGVAQVTSATPVLRTGENYRVNARYMIQGERPRVKVEIRLLATGQSIHFWSTRSTRSDKEGA